MTVCIDDSRCIRCHRCTAVCISNVFQLASDSSIPTVEYQQNCIRCGHCIAVCPNQAITLDGHHGSELSPIPENRLNDDDRAALFAARRSIRLYRPEPIAHALLEKALRLASYAPTARNAREVHWTIINGREKLLPLAEQAADAMSCSTDSRYQKTLARVRQGEDVILRGAPCLIVAHAVPWRWAEADCSAAISYMELALHSFGVGTCWSGMVINAARIKPLPALQLPEGHVMYAGLMAGMPAIEYARIPYREPAGVTWL